MSRERRKVPRILTEWRYCPGCDRRFWPRNLRQKWCTQRCGNRIRQRTFRMRRATELAAYRAY